MLACDGSAARQQSTLPRRKKGQIVRHQWKPAALAALALGALLIGGCAAVPGHADPLTSPAAGTVSNSEAVSAEHDLLAQYPKAKLPNAKLIREVTLDELPAARAKCLTTQGFPSTATADGGVFGYVPEGQDEAHQIAKIVCAIEYPLMAKYDKPLSDAQYKLLYDYLTGPLTKCLKDHGFTVPSAPSFQTFTATYGQPSSWVPYKNVNVSGDAWTQINEACPQVPANLYG